MAFSDLALILVLAILAFAYTGWTYRTRDADEFHTVSRKAGVIRTTFSIFTVVGAPHYAIFTTLAYFYGWWSSAFYFGTLTGLVILSILAKRIRVHAKSDAHSFADVAATNIGNDASLCFSFIGLTFLLGVVVAQLIIGAQLIAEISKISYGLSVLLLTFGVWAYLIGGGYRSLLFTDIIQGVVMLIFTAIIAVVLWGQSRASGISWDSLFEGASVSIYPLIPLLFIGGVLAVMGAPEIWQRILTARNDQVAVRSLGLGGVTMLLWGIFVVAVGSSIRELRPDASPGTAFIEFVLSGMSHWLVGIVLVALLVALLSTADTEVFASAVLFQKEWNRARGTPDRSLDIQFSRVAMTIVSLVTLAGAVGFRDLKDLWGVLLNLGYIAGPLAVSVVLKRGGATLRIRRITFFTSLAIGVGAFAAVGIFVKDYFSWWALVIIGASSVPIFIRGEPQSDSPQREAVNASSS